MGLATRNTVFEQDWNAISSVQQGTPGMVGVSLDGREYRYGLAGAADLAPGKIAQNPAAVANHQNLAVTATAAGATQVTVTLGATAAAVNLYQFGYLNVYDSVGVGQTLCIRNHAAISSGGTGVFNLVDPVITALTSASKVSLAKNPYTNSVIWASAATTGQVVGVPNMTITTAYYGWFQTKGIAAVLTNGTPAAGSGVIGSATTDGAVDIEAATTVTHRIGTVHGVAGVSTKYNTINLWVQ